MEKGHIKLDGKEYVVDLRSYKRRDVIDFSPRASVAGGSVYGELGLYQTLSFNDWQGGFGYPWHTTTKGNIYLRTEGRIDTRHNGMAMLFTIDTGADAKTFYVEDFLNFGGDVYAWSTAGAIKYTSSAGSWTTDVICTDGLNYMWTNGYYIFASRVGKTLLLTTTDVTCPWGISPNNTRTTDLADSDKNTVWLPTGMSSDPDDSDDASTTSVGFTWLHAHDGYVFSGQQMDSSGSSGQYVSYDDGILLEDLYTVSSDDSLIIPVGAPGHRVLGAESFRGDLLFRRADGIYKLNKDRGSATLVLDYRDQASTENFRSWASYGGYLVYPVRDKLYQWNGVRSQPMTPPAFEDKWPLLQYGHFDNFEQYDKWLFMTARTSLDENNDWEEHLIAYDGVGWHNLAPLVTSTDGLYSVTALHYDPDNDRLWYCVDVGTDSDAEIHYIPFNTRQEYPYENFPVASDGTNRLRFPRIAAAYRKVMKSTPSVVMEGMNCNTGQYLELYFRTDGSTTWLPWGADSGVSNVLTSDGPKTFKEPFGEDKSTVEYYYIEYAIDFVTSNATGTPILTGFYPRLLLRPDSAYGWSFMITAATRAQHGTSKGTRTAHDILTDIKASRDSYDPVEFIDIYGAEYQVYVTAVNEASVEYHVGRSGPEPDVEQVVQVNLVQVG